MARKLRDLETKAPRRRDHLSKSVHSSALGWGRGMVGRGGGSLASSCSWPFKKFAVLDARPVVNRHVERAHLKAAASKNRVCAESSIRTVGNPHENSLHAICEMHPDTPSPRGDARRSRRCLLLITNRNAIAPFLTTPLVPWFRSSLAQSNVRDESR